MALLLVCLPVSSAPGTSEVSAGLANGSLPSEIPRPGPDILYWPLAQSPQLENVGPWSADPILISGATAYRKGEFLYQDWIYDDAGAISGAVPPVVLPGDHVVVVDPGNPSGLGLVPFGSYRYPADPRYAGNAADIVEVRIKPLADSTAVRITYNTLLDAEAVATAIALGGVAGTTHPFPHGANALAPASVFVTVHGATAELVDAASGQALAGATATVDMLRRQVDVRVPYSAFDPRGQASVRIAAAAGLWDAAANAYLIPAASADATHPGGAGNLGSPAAFFNVAFRLSEPRINNPWGEREQSSVVASGDLSPFFAEVDFAKLQAGVTDDSTVPTSGYLARIMVSHFEDAQGKGADGGMTIPCVPPACVHQFAGRLQPYSIYVPGKPAPVSGYGLTIDLHGCSSNYNFAVPTANTASRRKAQFGERGSGSIVLTVEGRGGCYWYWGEAGADVFEAWADVAAHYPLDPTFTAITGESMGGYGSNKLAGMFPDLFARAAPYIPCPSAGTLYFPGSSTVPGGAGTLTSLLLPSYRNLPQFTLAGGTDVVCDYPQEWTDANQIDALGYRYQFWTYPDMHDLVMMTFMDTLAPIAEWMGDARVDRNPAHVTYVLNAATNQPEYGLNADHAYWVSGLQLRDNPANTAALDTVSLGQIDVFSHGFGVGDAAPLATQRAPCVIDDGAEIPASPCIAQSRDWGPAQAQPVADVLDLVASNIGAVTIDVDRARVNCDAVVNVQSDGPISVSLVGAKCSQAPATTLTVSGDRFGGALNPGLLLLLAALAGANCRPKRA
ncbi:MAG TPA: hypothetical protein VM074_02475 [Solimonas sp.]|nr:hypothetical protein [Solimonas sp.]